MAVYLDEDCLGTDPRRIGFPHLLLCMGVVVLTDNALYGVHIVDGSDRNETIPEFGRYLARLGVQAGDMRTLYGSCNWEVRYGGANNKKDAWKAEMRHIAGVIGFQGRAKGFDTSIIAPQEGTYVEYVLSFGMRRCRIFYKRHEKMNYGPKNVTVGKVGGRNQMVNGLPARVTEVRQLASHSTAGVIPTGSNQGLLHEVNYALRLVSFAV
jgi:hypothetical protein